MNRKQPTGLFPLNSSQFKLIWVTNFWSCFEGERNLGQFSPLNEFYNHLHLSQTRKNVDSSSYIEKIR